MEVRTRCEGETIEGVFCLRCNGMKGQEMVKFKPDGEEFTEGYACPECGLQVGMRDV